MSVETLVYSAIAFIVVTVTFVYFIGAGDE